MTEGHIYILVNASLQKDFLKIGMTTRSPALIAKELSKGSGMPSEYVVAYEIKVMDCEKAEDLIHDRLKKYLITALRPDRNREFYKYPLEKAVKVINEIIEKIDPKKQKFNIIGNDAMLKLLQNGIPYKEEIRALISECEFHYQAVPGRIIISSLNDATNFLRSDIKFHAEAAGISYETAKMVFYYWAVTYHQKECSKLLNEVSENEGVAWEPIRIMNELKELVTEMSRGAE